NYGANFRRGTLAARPACVPRCGALVVREHARLLAVRALVDPAPRARVQLCERRDRPERHDADEGECPAREAEACDDHLWFPLAVGVTTVGRRSGAMCDTPHTS